MKSSHEIDKQLHSPCVELGLVEYIHKQCMKLCCTASSARGRKLMYIDTLNKRKYWFQADLCLDQAM